MKRRSYVIPFALILTALAIITRPAAAAAPRLLMIYGTPLAQPVILDDFGDNLQLMLSISDAADITASELEGRPCLKLAYFWGQDWVDYVAQGKSIAVL